MPSKGEKTKKTKSYHVYFTLHVRLRLDDMKSKAAAEKHFWNMADADAVNDGSILETEVDSVDEAT